MNFSFRSRDQIPNYIVLTIFTAFSVLPIILLFLNSIKPQEEFGVNPLGFPSTIRWENYLDAWILGEYYKRHEKEPLEDLSLDGVGITDVGAKLLEELFSMPAGLSPQLEEALETFAAEKKARQKKVDELTAKAEAGGV